MGRNAYLSKKGIENIKDVLKVDRFGNLLLPFRIIKPSKANAEISDFNDLMRIKGAEVAKMDIKAQLLANDKSKTPKENAKEYFHER